MTTASALAQLWTPLAATARTAAEAPACAGASRAETHTVTSLSAARFYHLERLSSPPGVSGGATPGGERKAPSADKDAVVAGGDFAMDVDEATARRARVAAASPLPPRQKANAFVREAASVVGPCVVRIDVDFDAPRGSAMEDEAPDRAREASAARRGARPLRRRLVPKAASSRARRRDVGHGQGCGLVIDSENGLIVTNAHVIGRRGVVRVTLANGRSVPGDVVGVDALTDIALVRCRVEAPERAEDAPASAVAPLSLPAAPPLGDSAALEVGDWVIALGNPFGLDNTITLGIVSNLRRTSSDLGISDRRVDFLQTDCAINPGNSGGPLVNEFGEVVAITAAVRADAEGIGFAIPMNEVRRVVGLLAAGKTVAHAHVGVRMVDAARDARDFSTPSRRGDDGDASTRAGAVIVEVVPDSPAFLAGARAGDVCVSMEGEPLADAAQVRAKVEALLPGEPLTLTVARGGERLDLEMRAADISAPFSSRETAFSSRADGKDGEDGVVRGRA